MAKRIIHWYEILLSSLLAMLGFSSCGSNFRNNDAPSVYGVPTVDFIVKGTVTDSDGKPLKGIKMSTIMGDEEKCDTLATTFTDDDGRYEFEQQNDMNLEGGKALVAEDVDGRANGGKHETVRIEFKDLPRTKTKEGRISFDAGEYDITGDIKMKKK